MSSDHATTAAKDVSTCDVCGSQFTYYPSAKAGRFCSDCVADETIDCAARAGRDGAVTRRVTASCDHCTEPLQRPRSQVANRDHVFCDRSCYAAWLSAQRRANDTWRDADNPNWVDSADTPPRYGPDRQRARRAALDRDDHTCQRCGIGRAELGHNPDVHHRIPVRTFDDPTDAHTLDNLVTLCRGCHVAVERSDATISDDVEKP